MSRTRRRRSATKRHRLNHPIVGAIVEFSIGGSRTCGHVTIAWSSRATRDALGALVVKTIGTRRGGPDPWALPRGSWERKLAHLQGRAVEIPIEAVKTVQPGDGEAIVLAHEYWEWAQAQPQKEQGV